MKQVKRKDDIKEDNIKEDNIKEDNIKDKTIKKDSNKNKKSSSRKNIIKSKLHKTTKKHKSTTISKTKKRVNYCPRIEKLIAEGKLKKPEDLRVGYISRNLYGNKYIVKYDIIKKTKYFTKANKEEIACKTLLNENMNKFIGIYKKTKGKSFLRSFADAKKMALSETRKHYPTCLLVNINYSKSRENETQISSIIRNIKYYAKYGYYRILRLLF